MQKAKRKEIKQAYEKAKRGKQAIRYIGLQPPSQEQAQ